MYTCVDLLSCDPAPLAQWKPVQPSLGPMALATEKLGQEVTGAHCWNGPTPRRATGGRPVRAVVEVTSQRKRGMAFGGCSAINDWRSVSQRRVVVW